MTKNKNTRVILFDFFGTLVSYKPGSYFKQRRKKTYNFLVDNGLLLHYDDWAQLYSNTYNSETEKAKKTQKEFSMQTVMESVLQGNMNWNIDKEFVEEATKVYIEEWSEDIFELKNVHDLLDNLSQKYILSIVSNTQYASLVSYNLHRFKMTKYFKSITTSVEQGRRKPHPSIFKEALQKLDAKKTEAIFIGDNYMEDYLGAQGINMEAFLIDPLGNYKILGKNRLRKLADIKQII